jgi:lipopolysaccharide transport system permease protein
MYATPVIFPFSHVLKRFPGHAWIAAANPMAAVIENLRALFFGTPTMPLPYLALSIGSAVIIFVIGVLNYQRTARTFIDTV